MCDEEQSLRHDMRDYVDDQLETHHDHHVPGLVPLGEVAWVVGVHHLSAADVVYSAGICESKITERGAIGGGGQRNRKDHKTNGYAHIRTLARIQAT